MREARIINLKGAVVPIEVISSAIEFEGKNTIQSMIRDISDRKMGELAQAKNRSQVTFIQSIINHSDMGISSLEGEELRFTWVNDVYQAIVPGVQMVGRTYREVFPDASEAEKNLLEVLRTGKPWHIGRYKAPIPDDPDAAWEGTVIRLPLQENEKPVILGLTWDVTEDCRRDESIRLLKASCANLLSTIPDIVIMTDLEGEIAQVNEHVLKQSGYSSTDLIGKSMFLFIAGEDIPKALKNIEMRVKHRLGSTEYNLVMKDGRRVLFEVNGDVLRNSDGQPSGLIFVCRDLTERNKMQMKLHESNAKLKVMTSITRHDIKNQLLALEGNLALIKEGSNFASDQHLKRALVATGRISAMVDFTKEYENVGVDESQWQDVRKIVERCSKEVHFGDIILVNDIPESMLVFADPMLSKVFYNLIHNAVHHGVNTNIIHFYIEERNGIASIVCEDDGKGITNGIKDKLFTKGFGKNHGLGLFLSREILGITGITITEEGQVGRGAKFVMSVPLRGIKEANVS